MNAKTGLPLPIPFGNIGSGFGKRFRKNASAIILTVYPVLLGVLDAPIEPPVLTEGDLQEFEIPFEGVFFAQGKHFRKVLVGGVVQRRGEPSDSEGLCEFGGLSKAHVVAFGTFFTFFGRMFESPDFRKEFRHVVVSFDKRNAFDSADLFKGFEASVVFFFGLDVGVVPKTKEVVFLLEVLDGNRRVRTATNVQKEFGFPFEDRLYGRVAFPVRSSYPGRIGEGVGMLFHAVSLMGFEAEIRIQRSISVDEPVAEGFGNDGSGRYFGDLRVAPDDGNRLVTNGPFELVAVVPVDDEGVYFEFPRDFPNDFLERPAHRLAVGLFDADFVDEEVVARPDPEKHARIFLAGKLDEFVEEFLPDFRRQGFAVLERRKNPFRNGTVRIEGQSGRDDRSEPRSAPGLVDADFDVVAFHADTISKRARIGNLFDCAYTGAKSLHENPHERRTMKNSVRSRKRAPGFRGGKDEGKTPFACRKKSGSGVRPSARIALFQNRRTSERRRARSGFQRNRTRHAPGRTGQSKDRSRFLQDRRPPALGNHRLTENHVRSRKLQILALPSGILTERTGTL